MSVKSILQDWVMLLGLRHQGVLMAAVRGCDTLPKEHNAKDLARAYRCAVLNAHVGDPRKAKTFITFFEEEEFEIIADLFCAAHDELPHHYIMHIVHAAQVVGYYHPDEFEMRRWRRFYNRMCHKFHMFPEAKLEMDERLNASEADFKAVQ